MTMGERICIQRTAHNLSQSDLAERLGTFPIVKDTTPQTHAYITSRTLNFGGTSHEKTYFLRV